MAYSIGPTVAVKGEKEYQTAMKTLREEMKYLKAETQAATSEYDKNYDSVHALTAKTDGLKKSIDLQAQAVKAGEDALERLRQNGVEPTDKAYRDMEFNINNAKTTLNNSIQEYDQAKASLEAAAGEAEHFGENVTTAGNKSETATSGVSGAFSEMGSAIGGPLGDILGGLGNVTTELGNAKNAAINAKGPSVESFGAMAIAAVAVVSEIKNIVEEWANSIREMKEGAFALEMAFSMTEEERNKLSDWIAHEAVNGTLFVDTLGDAFLTAKSYMRGLDEVSLQNVARQANELSSSFGVDVVDVIKTASTMSKQFGIDVTDALGVIQETLKSNPMEAGELTDSLNEYSNQFKQMGFTAEEFGQVLGTAMENGAWSVDKVADAMKELNIRAKDGSDTTRQALVDLGLDADKAMKDLADGGDTAHDAVMEIFEALGSVEDAMKLNEIGVALMGSQWEDVGADVLLSLLDIQDGVEETTSKTAQGIGNISGKVNAGIAGAKDGAKTAAEEVGTAISEGIATGINKGQIRVTGAVESTMAAAIKRAKQVNQIESPSKVYMKIGEYMAEGLAIGFTDTMKDVSNGISAAIPSSAQDVGIARASSTAVKPVPALNLTINSPKALSPSETARQLKNTVRRLAWQ